MPMIAYLDLLGFRGAIRRHNGSGLTLLEGYNTILEAMAQDLCWAKGQTPTRIMQRCDAGAGLRWAERLRHITTFLPMSDSLVVVSDDANALLYMTAHFLAESALLNTHRMRLRGYKMRARPPLLFRGGIANGGITHLRQLSIEHEELTVRPNIIGPGLVDAVEIEDFLKAEKRKGPLVWIKGIHDFGLGSENLVGPCDVEGYSELLWPNAGIWDLDGSLNQLKLDALRCMAKQGEREWRDCPDIAAHYTGLNDLILRSISTADTDGLAAEWLKRPCEDLL